MFAISGIYDGKNIKLIEKIPEHKKYKVIVTFVEEISQEDNLLRDFSAQTDGLDFWNNPQEDIYQDYLNK